MTWTQALRSLASLTQRVDAAVLEQCAFGSKETGHPALDKNLWLTGEPRLKAVLTAGRRLGLPGADFIFDEPVRQRAVAVASIAGRTELLLATGCDDRVSTRGGVNSYGMPLVDIDPVLRGSSCTATPPDAEAIGVANAWRNHVLHSLAYADQPLRPHELRDRTAKRLGNRIGIEGIAERVILSASGTDVETLLTAFVLGSGNDDITIIAVGTREAGSGTSLAACGRAFRATAPFAADCIKGESLEGFDSDRIHYVDVELRDALGRGRRSSDVEAEVEAHLEAAIDAGRRVIVHGMGGAKTGLTQLTPRWIRTWRASNPELRVILDAAQARLSPGRLRAFIDAGATVIITGSKALCAPPFCGAAILDDRLWSDAQACSELPSGLRRSVSVEDLPVPLAGLAKGFPVINLPMLARWEIALHEWDAIADLGAEAHQIGEALLQGWRTGLAGVNGVRVLPTESSSVASIVSVSIGTAEHSLDKAGMTDVYRRLIEIPGVYVGQPVELAPGKDAVVRLAVGAATVNRLADDVHRSGSLSSAVGRTVDVAVDLFNEVVPVGVPR